MASSIQVEFSRVPSGKKASGLMIKFNAAVKQVKHVDGLDFPRVTGVATSRIRLSGADAEKCRYKFTVLNNNPEIVKAMWTKGTKYVGKASHKLV